MQFSHAAWNTTSKENTMGISGLRCTETVTTILYNSACLNCHTSIAIQLYVFLHTITIEHK